MLELQQGRTTVFEQQSLCKVFQQSLLVFKPPRTAHSRMKSSSEVSRSHPHQLGPHSRNYISTTGPFSRCRVVDQCCSLEWASQPGVGTSSWAVPTRTHCSVAGQVERHMHRTKRLQRSREFYLPSFSTIKEHRNKGQKNVHSREIRAGYF